MLYPQSERVGLVGWLGGVCPSPRPYCGGSWKRVQSDLFCVEWDIEPQLSQPMKQHCLQNPGLRRRRARVQIAAATLSGNSLRQTDDAHRASVHQAAKLVAALLRVAWVTAGLAESNSSHTAGFMTHVTGSQSAFEKWSGHVVPKCFRKGWGGRGYDFKRQRILK